MDVQGQLDAHVGGIKRDINGLILQLERIRRGEVERDILSQINHKHEIIQALKRGQNERDSLRQINRKHEIMQAQHASTERVVLPSESNSDPAKSTTPGASTTPTSFDSSQGSDPDVSTTSTSTSLPNFSTFLKSTTSSHNPPKADILVNPGTCPLCGRPCSQGNSWRHKKTCLGRCLNCTNSSSVCDDRGRGAPSHDCKACITKEISCVYLDKDDGKWKPKGKFANSKRFSRVTRVTRRVEEMH
ncbi:hypothetical protein BLS_007260 [Venturia inaequalis]|uniref:Uncharacterized protein n=1 Tax=Venturia inaequalis TaxID=5025 RepID=A0A8H3ZD43_VENIN|nr:hypothetical protein EG328_007134 [Venturia inaequalis]KAE9981568.1 hypothetical protein BLS_007260 [Venturia inaequalis]KAE9991823.1 hypothetical protein EG327_010925 [Venturia inaequalis]RDI84408.1 hypothetical protein Vi05172_g5587 [Venturia inaequalis]